LTKVSVVDPYWKIDGIVRYKKASRTTHILTFLALTAWHKERFSNHVFGREEGSIWEKNTNRSD